MFEIDLKGTAEDLVQAEQLIDNAKIHEAHELLNNFERKEGITLYDKVSSHLLRINLLFQQGKYEDVLTLTEETYDESLQLGKNLLSIDVLILNGFALIQLHRIEEAFDVILQGEELLRSVSKEFYSEIIKREAFILFLKGIISEFKNEGKRCLKYLKQSLELVEKTDFKRLNAIILRVFGWFILKFKGDMEQAFEYVKQGVTIAKDTKNRFIIAQCLLNLAILYYSKGDWEKSLEIYKECLSTFEEYDNKERISTVLHNIGYIYIDKGELDRSLECLERSLKLNRELGIDWKTANNIINIIINLIENHDLERANQYLYDLEQMDICSKDKAINLWYRFCKALLLKTSLRASNRGLAEVILKQILDEKFDSFELNVNVLIKLCELLLIELRMLNDLEVLEELELLVAQLLELTEKSLSYYLLAETHFFKGKIALLTLDMKEARKSLIQAQRIAERFGYNQLAEKISLEYEKVRKQFQIWENLGEKEISLSERMKLAGMDEHIEYFLKNPDFLTTQVKEKQITVHKERKSCIICKGDILGFMYACNCDALYCEKCARALTEIENACWVCGTPIDITKPIKPYKQEELEEEIIKSKNKK